MKVLDYDYDVVVCGGGLPGVCAAIAAARHGVRVALLQDRPMLGGNSSSECGVPPHGAVAMGHNRMARETGIIEELRMEYAARVPHGADNRVFWDLVLREWCEKERLLDLYLNTRVLDVEVEGTLLRSVTAVQLTTERFLAFRGRMFVDATGDGYVAAKAGATSMMGREAKTDFGEQLAPECRDSSTLGSALYCIAVKRNYPVKFTPPDWAATYHRCEDLPHRPHTIDALIPKNSMSPDNSAIRFFWWLSLGGDKGVIENNEAIYRELLSEALGVWDHLKNHCEKRTREALECYDLVWWSPFPLKRESRRIVGDYILTEKDLISPKLFPDRVGYGGWPIDLHPPEGIRSAEPPCDQTFLNELYSVPFRCLYSRDIENLLLAGRCISASHVALGSLRVMNTLAALGQAVGTAAAMCVKRNIYPRILAEKHVWDLQQQLVRDDVYIIGIPNTDPDDIAREAEIKASSTAPLLMERTDGYLELAYDLAQQIPTSTSEIETVEVLLKSSLQETTKVTVELYASSKLGSFEGSRLLYATKVPIRAGETDWKIIRPEIQVEPRSLLWVVVRARPGVYWGYGEEAFGTRMAVRFPGPYVPAPFEGAARIAPLPGDWISPNHHGRLPAGLQKWLEASGARFDIKFKASFNLRLTPTQYPYEAKNVVNGYTRPEDWPNIWISDPNQELPQWIELRWGEQKKISHIVLVFDTNLDAPDRMFGFPRERYRFSFPVPECVRDYRIEGYFEGQWRELVSVSGNYHRRREHKLPEPVITEAMRVTILATNGSRTARVYAISVR